MLGLAPPDRVTWALENVLVAIGLPLLVLSWYRFRLSASSYVLILVFLAVHEIGSHYTYSLVPYDRWFETLTGNSLNSLLSWERNHFDRAVHFLFGLLLTFPIFELTSRADSRETLWSYLLPVLLLLSGSALYELLEWTAAMVFAEDMGIAYVGAQGDVWDSHRDMALAGAGSVAAMIATALHRRFSVSGKR